MTGAEYLGNPEDMATLALVLYWAIATLLVGGLLFLGYFALSCYRTRKIRNQ